MWNQTFTIMIIPDGHDQEQPKKPKPETGRVLVVSESYQNKVDAMLTKMKPNTRIRIDRVCKKETQPKFIQAIKNFIGANPDENVLFGNDFKTFHKSEPWTPMNTRDTEQFDKDTAQAVARRNRVFRFWRQRLKRKIPTFCHNSAEYAIDDPAGTIESGLRSLKHAKIPSRVFDAWINRMESLAAAMEKHDRVKKADRQFGDHPIKTKFGIKEIPKSKFEK